MKALNSGDPAAPADDNQAVRQSFLITYRHDTSRESGIDFLAPRSDDIALHVGIYHDEGVIVLNDQHDGAWGDEIESRFDPRDGQILIEASAEAVRLSRDGELLCVMERVVAGPLAADRIAAYGDVTLHVPEAPPGVRALIPGSELAKLLPVQEAVGSQTALGTEGGSVAAPDDRAAPEMAQARIVEVWGGIEPASLMASPPAAASPSGSPASLDAVSADVPLVHAAVTDLTPALPQSARDAEKQEAGRPPKSEDNQATPGAPVEQSFLIDYVHENSRESGINFRISGSEDIALHFGIRQHERKLVLNDLRGGVWGAELNTTLDDLDGTFLVEISAVDVRVSRGGTPICILPRSIVRPLDADNTVTYGDLMLHEVKLAVAEAAEAGQPEYRNEAPFVTPLLRSQATKSSGAGPKSGTRPRNLPGSALAFDDVGGHARFMLVYEPKSHQESGVNFRLTETGDIPLHFAFRERDQRLVMNDYIDGQWGRETGVQLKPTRGIFFLDITEGQPQIWRHDDVMLRSRRRLRRHPYETSIEVGGDLTLRRLTGTENEFLALLAEEGFLQAAWLVTFDPDEYLRLNSDLYYLGYSGLDLLRHFITYGLPEGRQYSEREIFDPDFYVQYYADIEAETVEDAYRHWVLKGKQEGRIGSEAMLVKSASFSFFPSSFSYADYIVGNPEFLQSLPTKWHAFEHWFRQGAAERHNVSNREIFRDPYQGAVLLEELGNRNARHDDTTAISFYEKSLACDDTLGKCWQHLGDSLLRKQMFGLAARAYHRVEELNAQNQYTYLNLFTCYRELGRLDLALAAAQTLRKLYPGVESGRAVLDEVRILRFQRARDAAIMRCLLDDHAEASHMMTTYAEAVAASEPTAAPLPGRRLRTDEKPRIIIFGTPHLRQCLNYRINQKIEHLELAGYEALFISQDQPDEFMRKAAFYDVAIFYRVPAFPRIQKAIEYARARGMTTFYEIDDLIFDPEYFPDSFASYGDQVTKREYANLVVDTPLFHLAMSLCDYGIASTPSLQRQVAQVVRGGRCFLHRNAFDARHERFAAIYNPRVRPSRDGATMVTIFYGTATKAHNEDFDTLAAPGIAAVMSTHPEVQLVVAGYLTLPPILEPFAERVRQMPPVWDLDAYWSVLAGVDINIAVLKDNIVSDCKSEIKWLEAAMVGVPSVVSRTATYSEVLVDDESVMFAGDPEEWAQKLEWLVNDPAMRHSIGTAAYDHAVRHYSMQSMAPNIEAIITEARSEPSETLAAMPSKPLITLVNVFFPPQLVGGATRVVKDNLDYFLARHRDAYDFQVFCAIEGGSEAYRVRDFDYEGIHVFGVTHPSRDKMDLVPYDDRMGEIFSEYLTWQRPDMVHFHCIQRLTASIVAATRKHAIPYFVTVHDAWWISDYQFLVDEKGKLRDQDNARPLEQLMGEDPRAIDSLARSAKLRSELARAERVLAVSEPFEQIYRNHGVGNIQTVSNGVSDLRPLDRKPSRGGRVRLGLLGGTQAHKGLPLVRTALMSTPFRNLHLTVVDHAMSADDRMPETLWGTTPVSYVGKVPQERVTEMYANLDVLLAPSIWPESYGLVAREALACGLWVVASDRGAIGGDVTLGENGFIVDVSDVRGLIGALTEIDNDPACYMAPPPVIPRLRSAADQARELIDLYHDALARKPARSKPDLFQFRAQERATLH